MPSIQQIKEKLFFWKDWYPAQSLVLRNRGSKYSPELTEAARIKYSDKPNAHLLKTGEETKAAPLDYVSTTTEGRPFITWIEPDDGQLIPFKLDLDNIKLEKQNGEIKSAKIDAVVLDNKDERLNFWTDHLKESEDKYTIPHWAYENQEMIMLVVTAVSVAIVMFATAQGWGDAVPLLRELNQNIPSLTQAIQTGGAGSPPGN